jgi:hypothetical protein
MLIELAGGKAVAALAQRTEVLPDALAPAEHAVLADLQRGVVGEQVGHLVPLSLVEVVAVGALQALDVADVLQAFHARLELRHARLQGRVRSG